MLHDLLPRRCLFQTVASVTVLPVTFLYVKRFAMIERKHGLLGESTRVNYIITLTSPDLFGPSVRRLTLIPNSDFHLIILLCRSLNLTGDAVDL